MTEEEFKFLEVIYNRETIQEQAYINYLNGSLSGVADKEQYINTLFSKFREFGFIDSAHTGTYKITELGREKFEELTERKEMHRKLEHLSSKKSKLFHFDSRFWLAMIVVTVIVSCITSIIVDHWAAIYGILMKIMK